MKHISALQKTLSRHASTPTPRASRTKTNVAPPRSANIFGALKIITFNIQSSGELLVKLRHTQQQLKYAISVLKRSTSSSTDHYCPRSTKGMNSPAHADTDKSTFCVTSQTDRTIFSNALPRSWLCILVLMSEGRFTLMKQRCKTECSVWVFIL